MAESFSFALGVDSLTLNKEMSKYDNQNADLKNEVMCKSQPCQMAPPPGTVVKQRKRVAPSNTESLDDESFFIPGTQKAAISLLDLRPRKRNKEE